ncbi:hypothetical protein [Hymenobacter fodinae]|nr:hypothetical protein [Hymenobacter fodinae]
MLMALRAGPAGQVLKKEQLTPCTQRSAAPIPGPDNLICYF